MSGGQDQPLPDTNTETEKVRLALQRVMRSLVFRMPPPADLNELPISQLKCLFIVGENEGLRLHDVAEKMETKLPAASQIVDRLVRRGLFERRPDPVDRRAVQIYMTSSARQLRVCGTVRNMKAMETACKQLSPDELQQVTEALNLLANGAESAEAELCVIAKEYFPSFEDASEIVNRAHVNPFPCVKELKSSDEDF